MENEISILSELPDSINHITNLDFFLQHHPENAESLLYGRYDQQITGNGKGNTLFITPEFIQQFGIRSLAFRDLNDPKNMSNFYCPAVYNANLFQRKWQDLRDSEMIRQCQLVFRNCQVVSFLDWTEVYDAVELWDGLLREVIGPIGRRDFDFIFYLGDVSIKRVFDTDEILDIISAFSGFGMVTVVVSEKEIEQMERVLNGINPNKGTSVFPMRSPDGNFRSVFNSIRIEQLLIYSPDHTLSVVEDKSFEFKDRTIACDKIPGPEKNYFNAGYSMGLLLGFEMTHCIALGLAFSGSYIETEMPPSSESLISYIRKWMEDLQMSCVPNH